MDPQSSDILETISMASSPSDPFFTLPQNERRDVFFSLPEEVQAALVKDLPRSDLAIFIDRLDPDEVTEVLRHTEQQTRELLLDTLESDRREKITFLLSFDPDSAAGLMSLDYVTVDEEKHISEVIERVRRFEDRTGRVPTIFVTHDGELQGELPGAALSIADETTAGLGEYVQETPHIRYDREDEEVIEVFKLNRERAVAVLDEEDDILGVIHAEDLLTLLEQARGQTLYDFTGVAQEESVLDRPGAKIRSRYKWLILNLGTAFMAAAVVGLFESTIAAVAILAAYMPVVAGMGGNAGTQAMAVTVRGISLGEVSLKTGKRVIFNEVVAGAANGIITGVLVAVIAIAFSFGDFGLLLGAVIGISMVANLVIAGFFGAITHYSSTVLAMIQPHPQRYLSRPQPMYWAFSCSLN